MAELRDEDDERAAAVQAELDALVNELARAFGLSGRARKASNVAEKARINVTRAIRTATAKLSEALPGPGAVLDRRVRDGPVLPVRAPSGRRNSFGVFSLL